MSLPFDYNDPILTEIRKGTSDSPYSRKDELLTIENGTVVLTELPVRANKVQVTGNSQTWYEIFSGTPTGTQYKVDYTNKIVTFHSSKNGLQLRFVYSGKGLIYVPTSMIYTQSENGKVIETLKELTDDTTIAKNDAIEATEAANIATDSALSASAEAQYAANSSVMIWKPYVASYAAILSTYPNPEVGWTTQIASTGERYRFNGDVWVPIGLGNTDPTRLVWIGSTPPASSDYLWIYDDELELLTSFYFGVNPPSNPNLIWVEA